MCRTCSRLQAKISISKAELQNYVRRASYAESVNRPFVKAKDEIAKYKATIAAAKANLVDHEAEHADD